MARRCIGDAPEIIAEVRELLQFGYLTLRFFASDAISLLNFADQLVALTFDDLPVIVG